MATILGITIPIYLLIGIGYAAVRFSLFSKGELKALGKFVVNFAVPALLFTALSQRPVGEILRAGYAMAYAGGSLLAFLAGFAFARFGRRRSMPVAALTALGMSSSNSALMGYPIALQVVGPTAAVALAICTLVENVVMVPLMLAVAEIDAGGNADRSRRWHEILQQAFGRLLRNPFMLAIGAGLAVAVLRLDLPEPLMRTIGTLSQATTAVALFVVGGSLAGLEIGAMLGDVGAIAVGKLVLHPLLVLGAATLAPAMGHDLTTAAVVFASVPMLSLYPIWAQRYGQEGFCAAALLLTTLLSFATVSAALWLLTLLPA